MGFFVPAMTPIYIVGAGGIGCVIGYALRAAGERVTFVELDPAKVLWGSQNGVGVDFIPWLRRLPAEFLSFHDWQPARNATVFLCTKCYDNATVLGRLAGVEGITLIPVQNGFDPALEALDFGWEGIASFVSECIPHRTDTRITRGGQLHIGRRYPANRALTPPALHALAGKPTYMGRVRLVEVQDILPYKYTKLMYNAAIGPLAAAAGLSNGQLLSYTKARHIFFELIRENYAILSSAGIRLGKIGPFHPDTVQKILRRPAVANALAWAFYPSLRGSYCSMAPDLPAGRTEIDYYNGHLIELAGDRPCPWNRRLYDLIKQMEQVRTPRGPQVLDDLLKSAPCST